MSQELMATRDTLLRHNAGIWEGCFIRLDGRGHELERFPSRLEVSDRAGTIHADLTNGRTGVVRSMQFREPPPEMQISAEGHWSLGPDRIGAWPWVCELCLVWRNQRRRIVVRHGSAEIESMVLVGEARPGSSQEETVARLQLTPQAQGPLTWLWTAPAPLSLTITTPRSRKPGSPESVSLCWQPEAGVQLHIQRAYSPYGMLLDS